MSDKLFAVVYVTKRADIFNKKQLFIYFCCADTALEASNRFYATKNTLIPDEEQSFGIATIKQVDTDMIGEFTE